MLGRRFIIEEINKKGIEGLYKYFAEQLLQKPEQENTIADEVKFFFSRISSLYFEGSGIIKKFPREHEVLAHILNAAIPQKSTISSEQLSLWLNAFDDDHYWSQEIWGEYFEPLLSEHLKEAFQELKETRRMSYTPTPFSTTCGT